jgi:hypothetical protein
MHWGETWVCFSIFFTKLTFDDMGTILMCVVPKWDLWIITSANIYIHSQFHRH